MPAYITITDPETDPEAPLTSELAKKWRDNPLAIAEADSSVPLSLLPTVPLGTTTITAAASGTASSLVLTPYKFLIIDFALTPASSSVNLVLAGQTFATGLVSGLSQQGLAFINLETGRYAGIFGGNAIGANGGTTSITNASTSFSMSVSAGVMSGTFRLYGMK